MILFKMHVNNRFKMCPMCFILLSTNYYHFLVVREWGGLILCFPVRMRILPCGFMDLALEQCLPFLPTRITASRDRINNQVGFGKTSSPHNNILDPLDTLTSTILRLGFLWNISSRIQGKHPLLVLKANHQSSPNKYGKTATNLINLPVFKGLDVSLKVAFPRSNN